MGFYEKEEKKEKLQKKTNKEAAKESVEEIKTEEKIMEKEVVKKEKPEEDLPLEKNEEIEEELKKDIEKGNENHKKIVVSIIVSISVILVLLILCTGFALLNINNTKIMTGISVNEIEIKGLTKEEALNLVNEKMNENSDKVLALKGNDLEYSLTPAQLEVSYNIQKAIDEAYNLGRTSNIFVNNYNIVKAMFFGKNIIAELSYNEESLQKAIDDMAGKVSGALIETGYYIEEDKLIITKGKEGNTIEKDKIKERIIDKIKNNNYDIENINIIFSQPSKIDIDKIYGEVYTEPKDAYYTEDPFQIFPHVDGINFDKEAAREILKEDKEEYEISLTITPPNITTNQIGTEAFPNLLSSFTTKYDASLTGRSKNLRLAAEKIDGTVLMPGEIFSYNKIVGQRTIAKGYTEAAGYAGGKVVQTLGGGICQISSTLYDAAVYANLEIIDRSNHMFITSYIGAGKDATVVYGSIDFKFKNTRKYPIQIKASVKNGIAKMEIYGIKEEVEYEVEILTEILGYIPYGVRYEEDSSLAPGEEKVVQKGMNGTRSITYKILKLNGAKVSSTVLSTDTYDPMHKIIKRGKISKTTVVEQPEEPSPVTPAEPEPVPVTPVEPEPSPITPTEPEPVTEPIIPTVNNVVENSIV